MSEPLDYGHFDIILAEYLLEKHIREETFYAKVQQEVKVIRGYCR